MRLGRYAVWSDADYAPEPCEQVGVLSLHASVSNVVKLRGEGHCSEAGEPEMKSLGETLPGVAEFVDIFGTPCGWPGVP